MLLPHRRVSTQLNSVVIVDVAFPQFRLNRTGYNKDVKTPTKKWRSWRSTFDCCYVWRQKAEGNEATDQESQKLGFIVQRMRCQREVDMLTLL